jgi:hypothetical protein
MTGKIVEKFGTIQSKNISYVTGDLEVLQNFPLPSTAEGRSA